MERWKKLYRQDNGVLVYDNYKYVVNNGFCEVKLWSTKKIEQPIIFRFKSPISAVHEHADVFQEHQDAEGKLMTLFENDLNTILFEVKNSELKKWLIRHKYQDEDKELKTVRHFVIRTKEVSLDVLSKGIKQNFK